MTKHLKESCLLESKERAAEHQVCVKQRLMHMYALPKNRQRDCIQTRSDCVRKASEKLESKSRLARR